jgi:hypothetical protein
MQQPEPVLSDGAYFHADSEAVRFWVCHGDALVGASVSRRTLHYRFRPEAADDDPLETYQRFVEAIHAAVLRRVAEGALEPVMLREFDLRVQDAP